MVNISLIRPFFYLVAKMVVIVTSDRKLGDFTQFRELVSSNLGG